MKKILSKPIPFIFVAIFIVLAIFTKGSDRGFFIVGAVAVALLMIMIYYSDVADKRKEEERVELEFYRSVSKKYFENITAFDAHLDKLKRIISGLGGPNKEMEKLMADMGAFTDEKFGNLSYQTILKKLIHEAHETINSGDLDEFADCLMCLLAAARARGFTATEIIDQSNKKLPTLYHRKWSKQTDGTFQHEKK